MKAERHHRVPDMPATKKMAEQVLTGFSLLTEGAV